jgi:Na+/glutamate symporter
MSWKCDKCGNTYNDSVKQIKAGKFVFCPFCLNDQKIKNDAIVKKNSSRTAVKVITVAAAAVFFISISLGILFIKTDLIKVSIPIWVCGFVCAVILTAVDEALMKKTI